MKLSAKLFVGLILCGILGVLGFMVWNKESTRREVVSRLPDSPELSDVHPGLRGDLNRINRDINGGRQLIENIGRLSALYHANGYLNEAIQVYRLLVEVDEKNARWPHLLAVILSGYGQLDEAVDLWERARTLDAEYVSIPLKLGEVLQKSGELHRSESVYRSLLNTKKGNADALLGLGILAIEREDWSSAREFLLRATHSRKDFSQAWKLLAQVYWAIGDDLNAFDAEKRGSSEFRGFEDPWLDEVMYSSFDTYQLSVLAATKQETGNLSSALDFLLRAVELQPNEAFINRQLGKAYQKIRNTTLAQQYLETAVSLDNTDADSWVALIEFHQSRGNKELAENSLQRGLKLCPDSPSLNLMMARRNMSLGQHQLARPYLLKAIDQAPQNVSAHVDLAGVNFRLGLLDEGRQSLENALSAEPNHPVALMVYARFAIGELSKDKALELTNQVLQHRRISRQDKEELKRIFETKHDRLP